MAITFPAGQCLAHSRETEPDVYKRQEHYIEWIVLETEKGCQKVDLKPEEAPRAEFAWVEGDKVVAAYAYCNLHGLWKA